MAYLWCVQRTKRGTCLTAVDRVYDAFLAHLLRDHLEGRTNYQAQLFILASLELWFRVFIDGSSLEYPQASLEEMLEDQLVAPSL